MKEDYQKALNKLTLFFLSNPAPFNGQIIKNKKMSRNKDQLLFKLTKFDVIIPKITSAHLCKPIHDIINYSTSICPIESGKCGKEGKN